MNDVQVEQALTTQAKNERKMHSITPFVTGETESLMIIELEFLINRESVQQIQMFVLKDEIYKGQFVDLDYADKLVNNKTMELESSDGIWYAAHCSSFNNKMYDVNIDEKKD